MPGPILCASVTRGPYKISRNEFFITVAALAISLYNDAPNVKLTWIYNGREDAQMLTTVGLLFRDLPVALRFTDDLTLRDAFSSVHEQVRSGIEHSIYPYVEMNAAQGITEGELACLLYQQDIRDMNGMEGFDIQNVDIRQNQAAAENILDIQILDGAEGLQVVIDYAASRYEDASIEKLKDIYVKTAQALVTHNSQKDVTIRELRSKLEDRKNFFQTVKGFFSRKK